MKEYFMEKKIVYFIAILFGALWGISEAVLGYLLHLIPVPVSGFIMFPIGFFFMFGAYKLTQDVNSIIYVGIVAAVIKLVDLALPFLPVIKTLIPSAAILFEAAMVFVAYMVFKKMKSRPIVAGIVFASISWRLVFLGLQYFLTLFGIPSYFFDGGMPVILNFVLIEGLATAAILIIVSRFKSINRTYDIQQQNIRPAISFGVLVVSIITTITFSII